MQDVQQLQAPDWAQPGMTVIRKCAGVEGAVWVEDTVQQVTKTTIVLRSGAVFRSGVLRHVGTSALARDELFPATDPEARVGLAASIVRRSSAELARVARSLSASARPNGQLIHKSKDLAARLQQAEQDWERALLDLTKQGALDRKTNS